MNSSIVFLGDSLTEKGDWKNLLTDHNVLNYGISGNKTYEIYNRLQKIIELQADKIFLMAGINDLSNNRTVKEIINDYNSIIEKIEKKSTKTKLFLLSVLPVDESKLKTTGLKNENIDNLNSKIKIISRNSNAEYINLFNAYTSKSGQINPKYSNDGLHLTNQGYSLWKQLIKNYL